MITLSWMQTHSPLLLAAPLMALGLVVGPVSLQSTHAALGSCRADPIVTLSNGVQVQMSNTISDDSANVRSVAYTLRAPKGTSVVSVVYPPDVNNIPETFQFSPDRGAGQYESYAVVHDANSKVTVLADTIVTNLRTSTNVHQTAQDRPEHDIKIDMTLP